MPAATTQLHPPSSAPSSPGGGKKFSTIAGSFGPFGSSGGGTAKSSSGSNAVSNRPSSKNIFGDAAATANKLGLEDGGALLGRSNDGGDRTAAAAAALAPGGRSRHSTVVPQDGPWSVSVAETKDDDEAGDAQQQRSGRKATSKKKTSKSSTSSQSYTIYVTTPTHNLTLQRSTSDIVEMDTRLREGNAAEAASLPRLPTLASASTSTSGRKILKTLSRTLSPGGSRSRVALSHLTGSFGGNDSQVPTAKSSPTLKPPSRDGATSPPPAGIAAGNGAADEKTTHALASYFTTLSNLPAVRKHKAWKRFVRVRTDDLESVRVERRVHRVRSDLASHIKSVVAPTNTNVGVGPSQSDIGEDGGRTEDEREAASLSGRSGSRHSWGHASSQMLRPGSSRSSTDRPDVPARSTSVEGTPGSNGGGAGSSGTNGVAGNRSSPNFANIPEEVERERESSMTSLHPERGASTATTGATTTSGGDGSAPSATAADTSMESGAAVVKRKKRRQHREPEKVTVDDFEMIRVLGKGCAGKVLLVRHRPTSGLFAMKSIHKRHVLAHQELQHTLTEQAVLKRMARDVQDPFVVKLWWSFHDRTNLYLVMDFHPGGDLATQLSRWGRLGRDRARFYAAEIVEGVEGLHKAGVIYRDLKPENVLIGADGHIVLSDFGLSKEFPARDGPDGIKGIGGGSGQSTPPGTPPRSASSRDLTRTAAARRSPHWMSASASEDAGAQSATEGGNGASPANRSRQRWAADERDTTTTFCGTAEYLAPEVIQGSAYSYEVDWWSFGTMLYEMLTGITPFWADTHADMYVRVLHDELVFPDDRVLDMDTKSILRGLLQRNPMLRMKEPRIKKHPYFSMIEWAHVFHKRYIPPYIPPIDPSNAMDTQNFDEAFLDMQPVVNGDDEDEDMPAPSADGQTSSSKKSGKSGSAATGAAGSAADGKSSAGGTGSNQASPVKSRGSDNKARPVAADGKSLFDGYSFRGRKDSGSIHSTAYSESLEAVATSGANDDAAAAAAANAAVDEGSGQETKPAVAVSTPTAATPTPAPPAPASTPIAGVGAPPTAAAASASQPSRQPPTTASSQTSTSSMPSLINALAPTPAASYLKQQQMRAAAQQQAQTQLKPVTPPTRTTSIPLTESSPASSSAPAPAAAATSGKKDDSDSEDDETAARNAVLALAALEREADEEEASMRSGSIGVAGAVSAAAKSKHTTSKTIAETDGEGDDERDDDDSSSSSSSSDAAGEEEWDLLDLGTAASLGALPSEANGGKGQNLFARGVVDTYRLLRRQDSTRLTPSASGATLPGDGGSSNSGGGPSGVGSGRPFSRLTTRQRQRNAAAAALNGNGGKAATGSNKGLPPAPSATSVVSSDSRAQQQQSDMTPSSSAMLTVPGLGLGGLKPVGKTTSRPSSSEEQQQSEQHQKGSSGEAGGGGMQKSSSSRIKRRFTTFFEQAGR